MILDKDDKDIMNDVPDIEDFNAHKVLAELTDWIVHQMNTIIRRKRVDLLEKIPGSIFVRMLRSVGYFHPNSKMSSFSTMRPKSNDSLNNSVARIGQHMLTINSRNAYEHFNKHGLLYNAIYETFNEVATKSTAPF